MPIPKLKSLNVPRTPSIPQAWDKGSTAMWLASLVKFRHRCQAMTESFSIKDREVLGPLSSSWEYGAQASPLYEETLRILQTA